MVDNTYKKGDRLQLLFLGDWIPCTFIAVLKDNTTFIVEYELKGVKFHYRANRFLCLKPKEEESVAEEKVIAWMKNSMLLYNYDSGFDLAVDCASDLNLFEDDLSIPEFIIKAGLSLIPEP